MHRINKDTDERKGRFEYFFAVFISVKLQTMKLNISGSFSHKNKLFFQTPSELK